MTSESVSMSAPGRPSRRSGAPILVDGASAAPDKKIAEARSLAAAIKESGHGHGPSSG